MPEFKFEYRPDPNHPYLFHMAALIAGGVFMTLLMGMILGWAMNVITLFEQGTTSGLTIEVMMRIVGVIFFPIGAILGFCG